MLLKPLPLTKQLDRESFWRIIYEFRVYLAEPNDVFGRPAFLFREMRIISFSSLCRCGDVRCHTYIDGTVRIAGRTSRKGATIRVRTPIPDTSCKEVPHRLLKIISCRHQLCISVRGSTGLRMGIRSPVGAAASAPSTGFSCAARRRLLHAVVSKAISHSGSTRVRIRPVTSCTTSSDTRSNRAAFLARQSRLFI